MCARRVAPGYFLTLSRLRQEVAKVVFKGSEGRELQEMSQEHRRKYPYSTGVNTNPEKYDWFQIHQGGHVIIIIIIVVII